MNKLVRLLGATVLLALLIALMAACDEAVPETETESQLETVNLSTPTDVTIAVEGRTMTVTWSAVENAQGYEIYTNSVGCGSGKKIINTKNNTATSQTGTGSYLKDDKSNGAVEIKSATSIEITLMPATGDNTKPMASAVSAKVKALGGIIGETEFLDSGYSAMTDKSLSGGMGGG